MIHGGHEHAGDLAGDDIVGDAVGNFGIDSVGQEIEKVVIYIVQVFAVMMAIVQAAAGDLWELAGAVEALRGKWIRWRGEDRPVNAGRRVSGGVERFAIVEEAFIAAVPWVGFSREGIRGVGGSLVVAVDLRWVGG